ncbi:MAG: T9SS type A sorting domain-containing protein [Saprospiraceae bacterium]|nr:T9SS type A sorting domain-containing protein [Saprospiraceae bacterium]
MKNILSSQTCASQRTNIQSRTPLLCGGGLFPFILLLFLAMWCFVPDAAFGQQSGPGSAWTAGVNFHTNSPAGEDTWAFDAVEMSNGDFVVVGYAEVNNTATRVPAYAVLDKFGALKYSVYYDPTIGGGAFSQIEKTPDGECILAGSQGQKALLTKLNVDYSEEWSGQFDLTPDNGVERLYSVAILPSGKILLCGGVKGNPPPSGQLDSGDSFFVLCHYDATSSSIVIDNSFVFSDIKGRILDCKTVTVGANTYVLSTGYKVIRKETIAEADWKFKVLKHTPEDNTDKNADRTSLDGKEYLIFDYDVLVGIFDVGLLESGTLTSDVFKVYNSKPFPYSSFGKTQEIKDFVSPTPVANNLWKEPVCTAQYGPCTPGKSALASTWGIYDPDPLNPYNGSPVADHYLKNVSKDMGRSIIYTNGYVYVAAEMNILEMTAGFYNDMHRNGQNGVELRGLDCDEPAHEYHAYKDAYIHLLKFNLDGTLAPNSSNAPNVENVAHCSGGDFYATIVADQTDGKIVLGTTTADRGICGLPPIDECNEAEVHFLAKYDPVTLLPVWQQHYLSDAEGLGGSCAFGLIQTADNGFLVVGNSEYEDPNGHEDETFTIVKFTSDCISKTGFTDGDFTVPAGPEFLWDQVLGNRRVNGLITVPNGATLTISGITAEFANSKNLPGLKKCGIMVQPGGKLKIQNGAVLKGLSVCGSPQMWDGIIALGSPPHAQTQQFQAFVEITGNSRIEDAMRGTVLGDAAWFTEEEIPVDLPNGSVGSVAYHQYAENYTHGGGKLTAGVCEFLNCGKGVVWNPYSKFSNLSVLTNTRFECSGPMVDPEYRASKTALGNPKSTETFCEIQSNRGIRFVNCLNQNTAAGALFPNPRNRPSGIYSVDGQFQVDGPSSQYQNLYVGIGAHGIAAGIPSAISVNGAHFDNVYQDINLVSTMSTEVTGCSFSSMPNLASMADDGVASGVNCANATAYTVRSNTFGGGATNYGIISDNSALNGALIEGNSLGGFSLHANLFDQDNTALQTHCNSYQGDVADVSWEVKGVLMAQGDPFLSQYPDNRFVWTCVTPDLLDIRSVNPLSYFERTESANNTTSILKCTSPTVAIGQGASNGAPDCVVEDPCPNPPYCEGLLVNYNASGYALPYRNDLLNAYVRMSPTAVADSLYLPSTTRAITLLAYRNQQADKRMLTATYAAVGNFSSANQYLQQVTGSDTETQDFVTFYTVLINAGLAGRDAYQLTAAEFAQLAPLMTHNSSASGNVKALDHILNGVYHPLKVLTGTGGRPSARTEEESTPLWLNSGLSVFPNPFSDEVQFLAPEGNLITELRIMDVAGRLIFFKNQISTSEFTWQSKDTPDGILFYQCRLSDGTITYGKLLHSKKQ